MKKLSAEQIIGLVPDSLLDDLSSEIGVDYSVKKLKGKIIFKLFLYSIFNCKSISLRILEAIYNSDKFKNLFQLGKTKIKHSGIADRLTNINYQYFEKIFHYLINSKRVDEIIFADKKINVRKIDSTIVVLSSKLLKIGMDNNPGKKNLKYTVEINQGIPVNLVFFKDQKHLSEENALPEMIKKKSVKNSLNITIFDRGVQRKKTFIELNQEKINFISRLTNHKYIVVKDLPLEEKSTATLKIISDQIVRFQNEEESDENKFRLVIGINKETEQQIFFITNVYFLSAAEITKLYLSRWEIEIFFRFIKQELNFSHLLNRSENGIKVLMYLTMIAAILLTIYKKVNKIVGFAVAKIKFLDELESNLMYGWHAEISPVFISLDNKFSAQSRGS